ncbi:4'-phosphopantetheinyl transferase family protein [Gemmobacter serpentinus]|uniref:4'-phosphopantetheinyl transferase family protein n=1 Tax=Gemmobacter serpentinus TaxID=2652247 RepID=UPI00124EBF77|nr:4'-phosphopantetheinyl transferase superfamily protein [Gemmobacter serpentinus]
MILFPLLTENPFGLPGLFWREGRFQPGPLATPLSGQAPELLYLGDPLGPARATLPEALHSAVPKRQSEYLAGRICAALALRAAGLPEVLGLQGRAPVWPAGAAGSISHSDSRVVAAVSRDHAALGVDCETIMPEDQARTLTGMIMTPAETALRPETIGLAAFLTLVFSAKEALYKAISARHARMLEFHDVLLTGIAGDRLHMAQGKQDFQARFQLDRTEVLTLVLVQS